MNNNLEQLLNAVADSDYKKAKQYVKIIVDADNSAANRRFCNSIKNKLQTSTVSFMELPYDVKGILHMEDVSFSFNQDRYFLSDRENEIFEDIMGVYETSKKLSEMGIVHLNSIMLHGESGTGKTLFGKYIAYKIGVPFLYMNFSNVISSYMGTTGKNISKAFEYIENQKCVFMIDEVDAIGMKRGREDVGEMSRIVIGLMQALDCIKNDTIILGATNRIDMIDDALLRRFSMVHQVKKFSPNELKNMICKFLDDVGIRYDISDIESYCDTNTTQALAMNDTVKSIARSIRFDTSFKLSEMS